MLTSHALCSQRSTQRVRRIVTVACGPFPTVYPFAQAVRTFPAASPSASCSSRSRACFRVRVRTSARLNVSLTAGCFRRRVAALLVGQPPAGSHPGRAAGAPPHLGHAAARAPARRACTANHTRARTAAPCQQGASAKESGQHLGWVGRCGCHGGRGKRQRRRK